MTQVWTVLETLKWTTQFFESRGALSPRLDAELLLTKVLGVERIHLYVQYDRPLGEEERAHYRTLVSRRGRGEPVQYILGEQEFWSLPFIVTRDVLIPRPETEVLVEEALGIVKEMKDEALTVADVGVGSGPIAIAMLSEVEGLRAVAGDVSAAALDVAHGNARANGVAERVQFVHGAGLQPLFVANQEQPFDLVLSNPPYITEGDFSGVMREVREWEPKQALTAGAQGLDVIAPLIDSAGGGMLKPGGALLIEIGSSEQAELTTGLLKSAGFADSRIRNDYSGHARVVVGTL